MKEKKKKKNIFRTKNSNFAFYANRFNSTLRLYD